MYSNITTNQDKDFRRTEVGHVMTSVAVAKKKDEPVAEGAPQPTPYSYSWFHASLMMAAMFVGMQLTNWNQELNEEVTSASPSTWVKVASTWLCFMLYVWTLIAPVIFKDRDFSL